jgi:eukaryotic-like serine/threonine-protein kinase
VSTDPVRSIEKREKLGRYELICELASGGMGVVYLGRLQGVGGFERMFAIKVLHKHLASRRQIVGMLLNEARLAAQIQHPNVVSTVDAEISSSGQYYVVMEYVDGFTLCELLDHPKLDAVRRVRLGLRVVLDAMAGLDAAHRLCNPADGSPLQIVHRDVSPNNILVSLQGSGMIADFGIARATAAQTDSLPGVIKGTPSYMAPEQVAGSDDLDARADVFSLGAVLWEVLTGEQLFYSPAGVGGVISLVLTGEIETPSCRNSRVSPALDAVCLKALERDLTRRYQSVRELCDELERVGREQDLIASTHETAEALSQLFAEQIERRRASLPATGAARNASTSTPFTGEETLIATVPPPPVVPRLEVTTVLPAAGVVTASPPGHARAADDAKLPLRRAPWLFVAGAAAVVAASALLYAREPARPRRSERRAASADVRNAPAEQPRPTTHATSSAPAKAEPLPELLPGVAPQIDLPIG